MVKIRLGRFGRKKRPFYRILVTDSRAPRDSGFIEKIGTYDPLHQLSQVSVDVDKALEWLDKGAQPTDTVKSIFSQQGIMKLFDMKKHQSATPEQLNKALKEWRDAHPSRFIPDELNNA